MIQNVFFNAANHLQTPRDCIRFAVSQFSAAGLHFGQGTYSAWDEAIYLVCYALHLPSERIEAFFDATLLGHEVHEVCSLLQKRIEQRVPAAYLTHEAWLGEYRFYVDERVIVPRSFIAELIREEAFMPWIEHAELVHSALDLCTGSGCLAILMADAFPDAVIDAIDLSEEALAVAEKNVQTYQLGDRIELICSNLFEAIAGRTYDLVISNPPYVDAESVAALPKEYQAEPALALGSGDDGLDMTRIILEKAIEFLNPFGVLVVEIGHNREKLEAAYPELPFRWLETSGGDGFVFLLTREDFET